MADATNRLLIVDDEPKFCAFIEKAAARLGFHAKSLTDTERFMPALQEFSPSVLIVDLKMPGCDGVQLLQSMKDAGCTAHVIVVSGMDQRVLNTAEKLGRSHGLRMLSVLQKPVRLAELESALRSAMSPLGRYTYEALQGAIDNDELLVHYQPKIARIDGQWSIDGAEALVRWQHPADGLVMPDKFLGLAEESGLIGALTDYVLHTCVHQVSAWMKRGLNMKVSVNLSARSIGDLEFPDRLCHLLQEHEVPGSKLTLELTESAAMADPTKAMGIFVRVRLSDVGLAIDDFGTGFSSLQQLYQLPFDELKIDRTFVTALPGDDEARAIVRATVDMAHALGMKVCAEGIETRGALEYLESVNCDEGQGFLISRPVCSAEFEQLVGPWERQALRSATASGAYGGRRA